MLVITLGSHGSGSTWIFNVVRSLFAETQSEFLAVSADHATELLDNIFGYPRNVILKAHALDIRLLKIATLANAKFILSRRDPRDSVVSQRQRFSFPIQESAGHVTRAFASMAMIPDDLERLDYEYEDAFMERRQTVADVATFLGVKASPAQIDRVFDNLQRHVVQHQIQEWVAKLPDGAPTHDPETQWHASHIGDGRVGKWRELLSETQQSAVVQCAYPLRSSANWNERSIFWSSELFRYEDRQDPANKVDLVCDGRDQLKVYGPYLHLPAGRWRAVPRLMAAPQSGNLEVRADTYLPNTGRETVSEATLALKANTLNSIGMDFEVQDHFQPVEVRLMSIEGQAGSARFFGVDVSWLG